MQLALTAQDLAALDTTQKDAVLAALFTALIADGAPTAEERQVFDAAIAKLPWGYSPDELAVKTKAIQSRIQTSDREGKLAFLAEVAASVPAPELRERLIVSMLAIVSADRSVSHGEKASVSAFIRVFGFTDAQIEALRQKMAT